MGIKYIKLMGKLGIQGIFNPNGSGSFEGNNNHTHAKKNLKGVDFTSGRCLKFVAYEDVMPRQPATKELETYFPQLMGSIYGLVRGGVQANAGSKKSSAIAVMDAYTDSEYVEVIKGTKKETKEEYEFLKSVFFDQGTSSKPKESDLTNKKGEEAKDTSIFSRDNASARQQNFEAYIQIDKLEFVQVRDPDLGCVKKTEEGKLVEAMNKTFDTDDIEIKAYKHKNAIIPAKVEGVLLTDAQIATLVRDVIIRFANLEGIRTSSRIAMSDMRVDFSAGPMAKGYKDLTVDEALEKLDSIKWARRLEEY